MTITVLKSKQKSDTCNFFVTILKNSINISLIKMNLQKQVKINKKKVSFTNTTLRSNKPITREIIQTIIYI